MKPRRTDAGDSMTGTGAAPGFDFPRDPASGRLFQRIPITFH
jgi:hypothetical protein